MTEKNGKRRLNKDTLNLVVAVSAVLISAASFYAAYVQSEAAQKQVQAETWPYLQISHGNYDGDTATRRLDYNVVSVGVGPAHLKTLKFYYKDQPVRSFGHFFDICCLPEGQTHRTGAPVLDNVITGSIPPKILPPGDELLFFSSVQTPENEKVWSLVDKARFQVTAEACYCSLLDECFKTNFVQDPVPVKICMPEQTD